MLEKSEMQQNRRISPSLFDASAWKTAFMPNPTHTRKFASVRWHVSPAGTAFHFALDGSPMRAAWGSD